MTDTLKVALPLAGAAALAIVVALWAQFGDAIYLDRLAVGFIGCFS